MPPSPKCKVEPATGIIQSQGFEFIVIDTSMQIIAVQFYPASETKIMQLHFLNLNSFYYNKD
jgi:formyltetrahydrofolate hydrolase